MCFAIVYHNVDRKRFLSVAELVSKDEDFEQWRISPKDATKKAVIVQSDRTKQIRAHPTGKRCNWTKDGKPLTKGHLYEVIRMVE